MSTHPAGTGPDSTSRRELFLLALCVVAFVSLRSLLFVGRGFDMTDQGYHLQKQFFILQSGQWLRPSLTGVSDFVAVAWLSLFPGGGLFFARLGPAALSVGQALATFLVLARFVRPRLAAAAVVITFSALSLSRGHLIGYNDVPPLLASLAILTMLLQYNSGRQAVSYALMLPTGVLLALSVFAKPTYVLALCLPFLPLPALLLLRLKPRLRHILLAAGNFGVAAVTLLLGLMQFQSGGRVPSYVNAAVNPDAVGFDRSHRIPVLIKLYLRQLGEAIPTMLLATVAAIGLVLFLTWLLRRSGRPDTGRLVRLASGGLALLVSGAFLMGALTAGLHRNVLPLAAVLFVFLWLLRTRRHPLEAIPTALATVLAPMVIVLPVINMAGSNVGLPVMRSGSFLTLVLVLLALPGTVAGLLGHWSRTAPLRSAVKPATVVLGLAIILASALAWSLNPYRDSRNPLAMTHPIKSERSRHITTTAKRAHAVNELLAAMSGRYEAGDSVLAYNNIPMLNCLTDTRPALGHAWPGTKHPEWIKQRLSLVGTELEFPVLAVRAKTDTRNRNWPTGSAGTRSPQKQAGLDLIDQELREFGYREVWSNAEFAILAR